MPIGVLVFLMFNTTMVDIMFCCACRLAIMNHRRDGHVQLMRPRPCTFAAPNSLSRRAPRVNYRRALWSSQCGVLNTFFDWSETGLSRNITSIPADSGVTVDGRERGEREGREGAVVEATQSDMYTIFQERHRSSRQEGIIVLANQDQVRRF